MHTLLPNFTKKCLRMIWSRPIRSFANYNNYYTTCLIAKLFRCSRASIYPHHIAVVLTSSVHGQQIFFKNCMQYLGCIVLRLRIILQKFYTFCFIIECTNAILTIHCKVKYYTYITAIFQYRVHLNLFFHTVRIIALSTMTPRLNASLTFNSLQEVRRLGLRLQL